MNTLSAFINTDLNTLLTKAWEIRTTHFPNQLTISTPSAKTYISNYHTNKKHVFENISITGTNCALNCDHCQTTLLNDMIPISTPQELKTIAEKLIQKGCTGLLISGGAQKTGDVPLQKYIDTIADLKKKGLHILVHTGLITPKTAQQLAKANIDQALLDIIGDQETIETIYHLNKTPQDYLQSMKTLVKNNIPIAPHILIGLNYGSIKGEYHALHMITQTKPHSIVFVVITPKIGTPMEHITPPPPKEIGKLIAIARILNPTTPLTLGCTRPPGHHKQQTEHYALQAGINGIAYPLDETIEHAQKLGLTTIFKDTCCTLL